MIGANSPKTRPILLLLSSVLMAAPSPPSSASDGSDRLAIVNELRVQPHPLDSRGGAPSTRDVLQPQGTRAAPSACPVDKSAIDPFQVLLHLQIELTLFFELNTRPSNLSRGYRFKWHNLTSLGASRFCEFVDLNGTSGQFRSPLVYLILFYIKTIKQTFDFRHTS